MTKAGKVLTVFVVVIAVAFAGAATIDSATRTDWRFKAEREFSEKMIQAQSAELDELKKASDSLDLQLKAWQNALVADVAALEARAARWNAELAQLADTDGKLFENVEVEKKKVQDRLDELSLRREEVSRLLTQYEELVAEKGMAQADARRLRDLLVQAKGNLERVERRHQNLKSQLSEMK
jgi:DNA repair exonuclease SbcCD ATPase subunit